MATKKRRVPLCKIKIPKELGYLEPASSHLNGPSAKVLDQDILAPLGFSRQDAWLCDLLPETRINDNQNKFIVNVYDKKYKKKYGLNDVTIDGRTIKVLPLAHPRQIGGLGFHSKDWHNMHQEWEKKFID